MSQLMKVRTVIETEVKGVGEKVKYARKSIAGFKTLGQLCSEAGVSRTTWYSIEKDTHGLVVELETLRKIEKALDIDLGVEIPC